MTEDTTDAQSGDETPTEVQPTEQSDETDRGGYDGGSHPDGETDDRMPLSDLANRVEARRTRGDATSEDDELFEEVRVSELENDDVWTALVENEDDEAIGVDAEAEPVDGTDGLSDHIVPKSEFCQRCEYFGDPPELGCDHDGTTIVEIVDADHFRVRNCPMVGDDD